MNEPTNSPTITASGIQMPARAAQALVSATAFGAGCPAVRLGIATAAATNTRQAIRYSANGARARRQDDSQCRDRADRSLIAQYPHPHLQRKILADHDQSAGHDAGGRDAQDEARG